MRKYPAWSHKALDISKDIIHLQDVLMTGVGDCLYIIGVQDYDRVKESLDGVAFVLTQLVDTCRALIGLKQNERGTKPKWYIWAEDVLWYGLEAGRCLWENIEPERRANDWIRVRGRLEEIQLQCRELQDEILAIRPKDNSDEIFVSQRAVNEWAGLKKTFEETNVDYALGPVVFRYRRRSK